jgi:4-hydroxybenzoate polyprenyltransferase
MRKQTDGYVRLTRFKEYLFFVVVTTLLGIAAAKGEFGWPFVGVLVANWLAVAFSFMINDVEDAEDDALNPLKVKRNPVSARDISYKGAYRASYIVAALSAVTYALLGVGPFVMGIFCLLLGYFYSASVRLKKRAFWDLASHGLMLAGLQLLAAYLTFGDFKSWAWFFPFLFVWGISEYGELFNEVRDLDGDLAAGLRHTGAMLGRKRTGILMSIAIGIGVIGGIITIFVQQLLTGWAVILLVVLAALFVAPQVIKQRRSGDMVALQGDFHKPLEIAMALALLAQFIVPWAQQILKK